jgi:hypothetical protein
MTGIVGVIGLGAAWVVGDSVSVRRSFREQLSAHEEVEQRQRSELAVRDERMRIARELHDGVAHALAVITVQAGAARRLLNRGADVESALDAIGAQGRAAQDDLDVVLGLMRDETRPVVSPRHPGWPTSTISSNRCERQEHRSICTLHGATAPSRLRSSSRCFGSSKRR